MSCTAHLDDIFLGILAKRFQDVFGRRNGSSEISNPRAEFDKETGYFVLGDGENIITSDEMAQAAFEQDENRDEQGDDYAARLRAGMRDDMKTLYAAVRLKLIQVDVILGYPVENASARFSFETADGFGRPRDSLYIMKYMSGMGPSILSTLFDETMKYVPEHRRHDIEHLFVSNN